MRKFSGILFFLWFWCNVLSAQNIKQDLLKINRTHTTKEFFAKVGYKYYTGAKLIEEYDAIHIQSNGSYYFKIKHLEIISNNKCLLMVDHFSKSISVMPSSIQSKYSKITKIPIDTALKGVVSYRYKTIADKIGVYSISLKKGEYKTIEIYFDKKTYTVTKLKMHVSDAYAKVDPDMVNGTLEVIYKTFSKTVSSDKKKLLKETKFVRIRKKSVVSAPAYTKYELNNYLNIKPE